MEKDFLPEGLTLFDPLESARKAARWLFSHITTEPRPSHSEHYRGGAAQLDRALYDSDGNYHDRVSLDAHMYDSYLSEG